MRHRVTTKKLGRDAAHRKALLFNLSKSLIENASVVTSIEKAKYVKPHLEKLVTRAKKGSNLANRRLLLSSLRNKGDLVDKLFDHISKEYKKREGGYLSIQRLSKRDGDKATLAKISWVKNPEVNKDLNKDSKKDETKVSKPKKKSINKKTENTKK